VLERVRLAVRLVPPGGVCNVGVRGLQRHPPGDLEAAAPGGTCPSPDDFAAAALGCWFCMRDLQGF